MTFITFRSTALVFAVAFSCLCGWGFLHYFAWTFVLLGAPGGLAYLLISQTNAEDGKAKLMLETLYVLVNTVFYYAVLRFIQRRIFSRRRSY